MSAIRAWVTQHLIATDPQPEYSWLDRKDGLR